MLLSPLHAAQADDDHIEAKHLLDAGEILPLESILKNVRDKFPGKILEVKLERKCSVTIVSSERFILMPEPEKYCPARRMTSHAFTTGRR
jgi:hypothetical protein